MTFIDCRRGTRYEGERERERYPCWIRECGDLALRQNQFRAVQQRNVLPTKPTSVLPITINPGWVQCRYPLTRPVLPADGVFRWHKEDRRGSRDWPTNDRKTRQNCYCRPWIEGLKGGIDRRSRIPKGR